MKTAIFFAAALFAAPAYAQTCVGGADPLEANDDCATAVALPGNSASLLNVSDVDSDFFTVTLAAGEELTVLASFINVDGDIDTYLWDPAVSCDSRIVGQGAAGGPLANGFSVSDDETFTYTNASGATQNLVVEVGIFVPGAGVPIGCQDYDLDFTIVMSSSPCLMPDAFEANNDCASAMAVTNGMIPALNITDADPDFYSLTVANGDTLDITAAFIDADGDIDTYLWDPLVSCDSSIVGQGAAGMPLANGFSATDDEVISYTNTSGATQSLILEVSTFGAVACNTYSLDIMGAGGVSTIGTPFCMANNNSTGVPGVLTVTGSTSAAANNVTLNVSDIPPMQFGIFVVSSTAGAMSPVGEGILCLSNDIGRYQGPGEIYQADAGGAASMMIDLTMIPQPMSFEATNAGDTWFFQAWHRDFTAPPVMNTSNFTSGVEVLFN